MSKRMKQVICILACMFLILGGIFGVPLTSDASGYQFITGNNSMATAYDAGTYNNLKYINIGMLEEDQEQSWYMFSVPANSKVYVALSSNDSDAGIEFSLYDSGGNYVDTVTNPGNQIPQTGTRKSLYLNIDNDTSSSQTYYVVVERDYYEGDLLITMNGGDRIRNHSITVNYSGKATNNGGGSDSSILSVNLTNYTNIPQGAYVTSATTKGTQSPKQGNVRHKIRPGTSGDWYLSRYNNSASGMFDFDESDEVNVRQTWQFCYYAGASAKSTMQNVSMTLQFRYDISENNYNILTD